MGSSVSQAGAPPPHPPTYASTPPFAPAAADAADAAAAPPPKPHEEEATEEKVDYLNLPCPVPYEEIQREAFMALKPDLFEGMRFDLTKMITPYFALTHSVAMGSIEIPAQGSETMLMGRVSHEGRENIRVKHDITDNLSLKINAQLTSEPHYSQGMLNFDYKGKDFRSQVQFGNNGFYGANYIQSVSKNLSLGTEAFWLGQQRKSGVGVVARYDTKKMQIVYEVIPEELESGEQVATAQIATTGMVALSYVSLASDFMYNQMTKDVTASFGYDYMLRQCRLRGKLDTNGVISSLLEERLTPGVTFQLSAELDHWKKDYKFGFGMALGE
ncbi:Mitochondrial import receptor subunit TOM40-1 [Zea mays]|uniref:Mitochondrial import receptor subunit TOM40-1 n=2 Tax=Zea mays TaxID=4577 RepID=A0A8J8YK24_MAIZE|nr:Mitochondrial import receptor subunit TOM40-1 [Zea mays]PWZ10427.1 Mitochondrial import receptor subunit TOM40-1 [Zea mays]